MSTKVRLLSLALPVAVLATSGMLALSLGQDASWDLKNYHYYSGYAFLNKEFNYDFAPAQVQSFFNPLVHVPTYLMHRYLPGGIIVFLLGSIQGMNCWLLYRIGLRLFNPIADIPRHVLSAAAAAVGFYGAANLSELGTSFGDNLVSIPILASLLYIFNVYSGVQQGGKGRSLGCAGIGLLLGATLGLKLTAAIYIVPVAVALLVTALRGRGDLLRTGALYIGVLAGFFATYGYWGLNLFSEYHNPVFPYFNDIFQSEFYIHDNPTDIRFLPGDSLQTLFYPFYFSSTNTLASEIEFRDARLAVCYAVVLLVSLYLLAKGAARWVGRKIPSFPAAGGIHRSSLVFLAVFFVTSYVLWQSMFSIYRYLIVLELLAPLFIAVLLVQAFGSRWPILLLVLIIQISIGRGVKSMSFGRVPFGTSPLECEVPALPKLEESVVVLAGQDALSYVIPSFPAGTRFVRIEANFLEVGRYPTLERRLRRTLSKYVPEKMYCLLPRLAQKADIERALAHYDLTIRADSCVSVPLDSAAPGYLCGLRERRGNERKVRLEAVPMVAIAGRDTLRIKLVNLDARAVDVLYSIDGEGVPPISGWPLDEGYRASVFVDNNTRRGLYHIMGVRDAGHQGDWIPVDARVRVK